MCRNRRDNGKNDKQQPSYGHKDPARIIVAEDHPTRDEKTPERQRIK